MHSPKDILLSVLSEAGGRNKSLGKTRLVKLLYLAEVEFFRETAERLTDLTWLFYHYGPYALELEDILAGKEFQRAELKTKDDKDVILFKGAEPFLSYARTLDVKVSLIIKRIVGQWIDRTLSELLDYVYFETEPMQTASKRGEVLDFTNIKKEVGGTIIPLTASKETRRRVEELRKRLEPVLKRLSELRPYQLNNDEDYRSAMDAWEDDLGREVDPESLGRISLIITRPSNDTGEQGN